MSSRDSLDDQLDVVLAVLVDEWVDFLHRGEKGEGVVALKRAKQAIQEHIESKVLEGRIKELEMLPIMRKALHTPQKDLDIILVDTVNNRIKQLKRIEELTKQSEKSDE